MMRGVSDSSDRGAGEQRGEVLDMLRTLLTDGRADDVVSLVAKLVENNTELAVRAARADELATRNVELEKQLEKLLARVKKSETVSKAQLVLFADAIRRGEAGDVLAEGDPRRTPTSGCATRPESTTRRSQRPSLCASAPRVASLHRRICRACPIRSTCPRMLVRVRAVARSARASATTPPRSSI